MKIRAATRRKLIAATQLFKRQSKNRTFFKLSNFILQFTTPGQDREAKNYPQRQLEGANPPGSPGGGGLSGSELTYTLRNQ